MTREAELNTKILEILADVREIRKVLAILSQASAIATRATIETLRELRLELDDMRTQIRAVKAEIAVKRVS